MLLRLSNHRTTGASRLVSHWAAGSRKSGWCGRSGHIGTRGLFGIVGSQHVCNCVETVIERGNFGSRDDGTIDTNAGRSGTTRISSGSQRWQRHGREIGRAGAEGVGQGQRRKGGRGWHGRAACGGCGKRRSCLSLRDSRSERDWRQTRRGRDGCTRSNWTCAFDDEVVDSGSWRRSRAQRVACAIDIGAKVAGTGCCSSRSTRVVFESSASGSQLFCNLCCHGAGRSIETTRGRQRRRA